MRPIPQADGHNGPRLISDRIPGITAMSQGVLVRHEYTQRDWAAPAVPARLFGAFLAGATLLLAMRTAAKRLPLAKSCPKEGLQVPRTAVPRYAIPH